MFYLLFFVQLRRFDASSESLTSLLNSIHFALTFDDCSNEVRGVSVQDPTTTGSTGGSEGGGNLPTGDTTRAKYCDACDNGPSNATAAAAAAAAAAGGGSGSGSGDRRVIFTGRGDAGAVAALHMMQMGSLIVQHHGASSARTGAGGYDGSSVAVEVCCVTFGTSPFLLTTTTTTTTTVATTTTNTGPGPTTGPATSYDNDDSSSDNDGGGDGLSEGFAARMLHFHTRPINPTNSTSRLIVSGAPSLTSFESLSGLLLVAAEQTITVNSFNKPTNAARTINNNGSRFRLPGKVAYTQLRGR
jgi:hypothetical protein